jgi:hypothetical protein
MCFFVKCKLNICHIFQNPVALKGSTTRAISILSIMQHIYFRLAVPGHALLWLSLVNAIANPHISQITTR